jgi:cytochrome P450
MPTVNLVDEELLRDPCRGYARIRAQAPLARGVSPGMDPVWLVIRYDDVKEVLSDPRFVNNPANVPGIGLRNVTEQALRARGVPAAYLKYRLNQMLEFDGADHARLRGLVSQAFTVRRVAALRPRTEEITRRLLDRLPAAADAGVVDLMRHFASPFPDTLLCDLVGIPAADRARWRRWRTAIWPRATKDGAQAWPEMIDYLRELIARRRAEPADDLISGLIRAHDEDGDRLSETEMITMILILGQTGHLTTVQLIGLGVLALLTHPAQLALLRDDPELMPRAVHELLRWCGPAPAPRARYATEDLHIGGMPVRKGEAVVPSLLAANYDPGAFPDPGRFDITRAPDGRRESHVAFGAGPHYCLGAALARQEAEVAFGALLRRYPGLTLAVDPGDLEREPAGDRGLRALPVRL